MLWIDIVGRPEDERVAAALAGLGVRRRTLPHVLQPIGRARLDENGTILHLEVTGLRLTNDRFWPVALNCVVGANWPVTSLAEPVEFLDGFRERIAGGSDLGDLDAPSSLRPSSIGSSARSRRDRRNCCGYRSHRRAGLDTSGDGEAAYDGSEICAAASPSCGGYLRPTSRCSHSWPVPTRPDLDIGIRGGVPIAQRPRRIGDRRHRRCLGDARRVLRHVDDRHGAAHERHHEGPNGGVGGAAPLHGDRPGCSA